MDKVELRMAQKAMTRVRFYRKWRGFQMHLLKYCFQACSTNFYAIKGTNLVTVTVLDWAVE